MSQTAAPDQTTSSQNAHGVAKNGPVLRWEALGRRRRKAVWMFELELSHGLRRHVEDEMDRLEAVRSAPSRSISGVFADDPSLTYETTLGRAFCGDAIETLQQHCEDESVDLIVTSPPFALQRPKSYGNVPPNEYVDWFLPFADEFWRVLKPSGSLVIDLGGSWEAGVPVKSLYAFELLIALCRRSVRPFVLAQDFYWYNPARLPSPAQWVTVKRVRVKDSVNYVWWLAKTASPDADNRRILRQYTSAMQKLLDSGTYNRGARPSGHVVREGFVADNGGAIPPNILALSNTGNDSEYVRYCQSIGVQPHPARFPADLPAFFIEFLTRPGGLVVDPFAGSNVTGSVAERMDRRWLATDLEPSYIESSRSRFEGAQLEIS